MQRVSRLLANHLSAVAVGTISSALGALVVVLVPAVRDTAWNFAVGQWQLCLALVGVALALVSSMLASHWRRVAGTSVANSSRFEATLGELQNAQNLIAALRKEVESHDKSKPVDLPDNNHRRTFRAVLNYGSASISEIAEEIGLPVASTKEFIKALRLDYGYFQRCAHTEVGEPMYSLTPEGEDFAEYMKWRPVLQSTPPTNVAPDGFPTAKRPPVEGPVRTIPMLRGNARSEPDL
jgi:hypothetical protein